MAGRPAANFAARVERQILVRVTLCRQPSQHVADTTILLHELSQADGAGSA